LKSVHVIGGGLAGCEATFQLLRRGIPVVLHEMRPAKSTPAHKTAGLAELVCSNSLRSDDPLHNAVGVMHEEMRQAGSLIMAAADHARIPAGGALAVDRDDFSAFILEKLQGFSNFSIKIEEMEHLPSDEGGKVIIATGPLTSDALAEDIRRKAGTKTLHFFDALAPIALAESIDMDRAFIASRYRKGEEHSDNAEGDYINCPMNREEYLAFYAALMAAEKVSFHDWENVPYFEGCLPIEVMAERGVDTLRFGPMKPVGLTDPRTGRWPYAVVQLRRDNTEGTLYNMVGFQTKLKHGEQIRVFRMIPGLENAEFVRLGGMHRNTFLNSPELLDSQLRLKSHPHIRFAGQVAGCEGYVESASLGLLSGLFVAAELLSCTIDPPPATTALGAMLRHVVQGTEATGFQPMNINFGIFPPPEGKVKGRERKEACAKRALADAHEWLKNLDKALSGA